MAEANKTAIERVKQEPHEGRAILEAYRDKIDQARAAYNEAAAAYLKSYDQELAEVKIRLEGIRSDSSKLRPTYEKSITQRPLAKLAEKIQPGTIEAQENHITELRRKIDTLARMERNTLESSSLGDPAAWRQLLSKEQELYEIEEEGRLTRLAICDAIGDMRDELNQLLNELIYRIPQTVTVRDNLEFYKLEDVHDSTVRELIEEQEVEL